MDKDLAPRRHYNYLILTAGLGLVIVSIIHQGAMNTAMNSDNFGPFILTTTLWGFFFITIMIINNKCRYVKTISTADKRLKIGNLLSNSEVSHKDITIIGKTLGPLYKIEVDRKSYYIVSSDKLIEAYRHWVQ